MGNKGIRSIFVWTLILTLSSTGFASYPDLSDAKRFQKNFWSTLNDQSTAEKLYYLPSPNLINFPNPSTFPESQNKNELDLFLDLLKKHYGAMKTSQLYQNTKSLGRPNILTQAQMDETLRAGKITFVIVPGVTSEFTDLKAWNEIFARQKSAFRDKVVSEFANLSEKPMDYHFDLKSYSVDETQSSKKSGNIKYPLQNLFSFSSLDDENGRPLVNFIVLETPSIATENTLSLESIGSIKTVAKTFDRRLQKLFSIIGSEIENVALVGYSRGTPTALEMLSNQRNNKSSWTRKVRAMISMGGVAFGSDSADEIALGEGEMAMQIKAFEDLVGKLRPDYSFCKQNYEAWVEFGSRLVLANPKYDSTRLPEREKQGLSSVVRTGKDLFKKVISGRYFEPGSVIEIVFRSIEALTNLLENAHDLAQQSLPEIVKTGAQLFNCKADNYYTQNDYPADIIRFKKVYQEALPALKELTTDARMMWWATHEIPTKDIIYYSVGGTLAAKNEASDLFRSNLIVNLNSDDDLGQLNQYVDFSRFTKEALHDGRVSAYKIQFWPQLIEKLNPKNQNINSKFLGLVGSHHLGLAFPFVTHVKNESQISNPFPREAFAKAIALTVAEDLQKSNPSK